MTLQHQLYREFSSTIRERGQRYQQQNRVTVFKRSAKRVLAMVRGSSTYTVELALAGKGLQISCTCPYYDDHNECKHIWAAMLEADDKGLLQGGTPRRLMPLYPEDEDDDEDWDDDEFDIAGEEETLPETSRSTTATKSKAGKPARPPREDWRRDLAELKQAPAPWPLRASMPERSATSSTAMTSSAATGSRFG